MSHFVSGSLALAPPRPPPPPHTRCFPGVQFNSLLTDRRALLYERRNRLISFLDAYQRVIKRRMLQILLVSNSTELCTLKLYYRNY